MKLRKNIILAIIVNALIMTSFLASCADQTSIEPGMKINSTGYNFALKLASTIPFRKAYSEQEKSASQLIVKELEDIGFKPQVITFTKDKKTSQNIVVTIEGKGFSVTDEANSQPLTIRKKVIVGAHYDTLIGIEQKKDYPDYDGIQENASGVGALISIAKELKSNSYGYDITLVFFGAGGDAFEGSKNYFESLPKEDIANYDVMYCIESIYAGDKLYAHAGFNSTVVGKKYERRRKLYEIFDVAAANSIDLRFNESDLDIDIDGDKKMEVYREITSTKSDYSVFDAANIPCVFIESYDYYGASKLEQLESKNPAFSETKGIIRGTKFDSSKLLTPIIEKTRLETRIKNTAFLVVNAIGKGIYKSTSTK